MAISIQYKPAGPVARAFHESQAFVRGLRGPVGSSKSSACCMEIFHRGCEQAAFEGVRRTRWGAIRASYRELETTTLETWKQWFPFARTVGGSPICSSLKVPLGDGTQVEIEVLFFPISRPDEVDAIASLELTGIWINEARELPMAVLNKATERVGRYPAKRFGGPTWRGVMMDTNAPDDDHWWHGLAEGTDRKIVEQMRQTERKLRELGDLAPNQKLYEFFGQPGGLLERGGEYFQNPAAENIANLDGGYAYYFRQIPGKTREWIKAQILGQYASVADGKPVYPEYNDDLHCRQIEAQPDLPLLLGFDYGLTPACAICQLSPRGQLLVIDELFGKDMDIQQFARDVVRPHLALHYHGMGFQAAGDPSGMSGKRTEQKTAFMLLAEEGIACMPTASNDLIARRNAVVRYLTKLVGGGEPALIVDPRCDMIRKGFNGRYQYKRIQVIGEDRFRDIPVKNDYSHLHDALQYAAQHSLVMSTESWGKPIVYPQKSGIV